MVLGGRNIKSVDTLLSMVGLAGQLSTDRTIFRPSLEKSLYAVHPAFLQATIPTGQVVYMFETSRFIRLAN